MQKYVLDRNGNVVATFASDYNDKHTKTLQAGASTYEFTISKQDEAALFLETGNYVNFVDDVGKPWSFSILSYTETHNEKTVYCEDVGIELINKNVNAYKADAAYSFSFYFEMITKNTPWTIGINEIGDLSRKLEWTSNDTGLSRLLSLLTEFDNAECKFNVKFAQNKPTVFKVDIYKQIGNPSTNVQIVYSNELNDITKTESHAEFVTAIQGEGGTPTKNADGTDIVTGTNPDGTTIETPKITFADVEYKDDNYVSAKGDNFLRAVTANKLFNPNSQDAYIEGYYSYDTESPQELLNRTLTQLKKYSTPQYTYEADVQVIDKNLDLGDTVKIIDHDYKPGLYLEARVASLEKSYTDPSKNTITFTNYKLINSSLAQKLADLQNIINSMPTASGISSIVTNVINNSNVIEQKILALQSADGRSTVYYDANPSNAKEGDTAFVKNPDSGNMEIWNYVGDQWTLTTGDATFDGLKTQIDKAQTDAQTAITNANSAVSTANQAVSAAGFANNTADQAKTAAANAQSEASSAFAKADSAVASALSAQSDASAAVTQALSAAADSKDAKQLAGAVSQSYKTLTDGSTMTIAELESGLAVKLTKKDLDGYATETWAQNQINVSADGINGTMSSIKSTVDGQTTSINDLKADSSSFKSQFTTVNDTLGKQTTDIGSLQASSKELTSGFNTLTTDNGTNKNDISQLKQTATEVSSTLETVKTQVQDSSVGTNLIIQSDLKSGYLEPDTGGVRSTSIDFNSDDYIATNGKTVFTFSSPDYAFKGNGTRSRIAMYDSNKNYLGYQPITSPTQTLSNPNAAYIRFSINSADEGNTTGNSSDWLDTHRYKLEKGSLATDWCANPADNATVTSVSKLSQTVDGMKVDVSNKIEQKDLNGYATQSWSQGQISVAKNEITASVQNMTSDMATQTWTQGKLNLTADGLTSQISSVQNGLNEKYTSLEQTLSGVQVTANDAVTQSQYTQLAGQITSVISDPDNLIIGGDFEDQRAYIGKQSPYWSGIHSVADNEDKVISNNPSATVLQIPGSLTGNNDVTGLNFIAVSPVEYKFSLKLRWTSHTQLGAIMIYAFECDANKTLIAPKLIAQDTIPMEWHTVTGTYTPSSDKVRYIKFDVTYNGAQGTTPIYVDDIRMSLSVAAQSQITQLQSDINLRVQKDDVINQINISPESILIAGQKVHITGQTTIDSGIITNAMIANATITGAQIANATIIDANIANINGSKITANSITGDKLAVNAILVGLNGALGKVTIEPDLISVSQGTSAKATKLDMNGIHFTDASGNDVGFFHSDTMTTGAGGVTLSGNLLVSQEFEVNQMYAVNKSGLGAWVVRDTGAGIGIPGFGILNASQNGGIYFADDDGIWLGAHGSWKLVSNLQGG